MYPVQPHEIRVMREAAALREAQKDRAETMIRARRNLSALVRTVRRIGLSSDGSQQS